MDQFTTNGCEIPESKGTDLIIDVIVASLNCPNQWISYQSIQCIINVNNKCNITGLGNPIKEKFKSVVSMVNSIETVTMYYDIIQSVFGDSSWLNVTDNDWANQFLSTISDSSEDNILISELEAMNLTSQSPIGVTINSVTKFIDRWNLSQKSLRILTKILNNLLFSYFS